MTWRRCSVWLCCNHWRDLQTLLIFDGPHHEVHTGCVGMTTELERIGFPRQPFLMESPLDLWLAAAELLQNEVMNLRNEARLHIWPEIHMTRSHTAKSFQRHYQTQTLKKSSFNWNNNLSCNRACLAASWTCWRTAGRWRLCRRARCLDSPSLTEEQNQQTNGLES